MGLLAGLCWTSASLAQPNQSPEQPATKSEAEADRQSPWAATRESRICRTANLIVVGTVIDLEYGPPTWRPDVKPRGTDLITTATVRVDGVAAGNPPPTVVVKYSGGHYPDGSWFVDSDQPNLSKGAQYVLFVEHRSKVSIYGTDFKIVEQIKLDEPVDLPPDSVLNGIWVEHCVPGASLGNRPTQGLLPLLSDSWIHTIEEICEHY